MLYACRSWKDPEQLENRAFLAHFRSLKDDGFFQCFLLETFIMGQKWKQFHSKGSVAYKYYPIIQSTQILIQIPRHTVH